MGYGPVITAIDSGHVDHEGRCPKCKTKFPCSAMKRAKVEQRQYAEDLARQQRTRLDVTRFGA